MEKELGMELLVALADACKLPFRHLKGQDADALPVVVRVKELFHKARSKMVVGLVLARALSL